MKTAWYWHENRQVNQWNQIEDRDNNPHTNEYLIFDKEAKKYKMENRKPLQQMVLV